MAEKGAHLTETIQSRPSIFDVVASDNLNSTFHPAFLKLANYIAKHNPQKLGWLVKYYEEVFLVLNGLIQNHYLRTYSKYHWDYPFFIECKILNIFLFDWRTLRTNHFL